MNITQLCGYTLDEDGRTSRLIPLKQVCEWSLESVSLSLAYGHLLRHAALIWLIWLQEQRVTVTFQAKAGQGSHRLENIQSQITLYLFIFPSGLQAFLLPSAAANHPVCFFSVLAKASGIFLVFAVYSGRNEGTENTLVQLRILCKLCRIFYEF